MSKILLVCILRFASSEPCVAGVGGDSTCDNADEVNLMQLTTALKPGDLVAAVKSAWAPVHNNWFHAKDEYMFKDIVPIDAAVVTKFEKDFPVATTKGFLKSDENYKVALGRIQAAAKGHKTGQTTSQMTNLVTLRSKFMCDKIFGAGIVTTCMHRGNDALKVPIPAKIKAAGGLKADISFTAAQQKCTAQALGSVTSLSDLDFTASCGARTGVTGDAPMKQAMDEVHIAEQLTDAVEKIAGQDPGLLFDTNFYTNTLTYSKDLAPEDCKNQPLAGLAMGIYAVARGLHAMGAYSTICNCGTGNSAPLLANGLSGNNAGKLFKELTSKLKSYKGSGVEGAKGDLDKYYGIVANEQDVANMDGAPSARTAFYFKLLKESLQQTDKTKNKDFCVKNSGALILANEAYWNTGAIKQVLTKDALTVPEGVQAVFMNLGYAMEHLYGEMIKGDDAEAGAKNTNGNTYGKDFDDRTMAMYGDGLIKYGKYMDRAIKALKAIKLYDESKAPFNDATVKEALDAGKTFIAMKDFGKHQESSGNLMGLPTAYVFAYTAAPRERRCKMLQAIVKMVTEIFMYLMKKYPK